MTKEAQKSANCWFCNCRPAQEKSVFNTKVFKPISRKFVFPNTIRTKYLYIDIYIPRCSECKKNHTTYIIKLVGFSLIFVLIGLIFGLLLCEENNNALLTGVLDGTLFGILSSYLIYSFLKNCKADVKSVCKYSIKKYPDIAARLEDGWKQTKSLLIY